MFQDWNKKREDLECEDLKDLPKPEPIHCHIPNQFFGDFIALLEFLNSFSDSLGVKESQTFINKQLKKKTLEK